MCSSVPPPLMRVHIHNNQQKAHMPLSPQATAILAAINTLKAAGIDANLRTDVLDGLTGHITLPLSTAIFEALVILLGAGIDTTLTEPTGPLPTLQMRELPGIPGTGGSSAVGEVLQYQLDVLQATVRR